MNFNSIGEITSLNFIRLLRVVITPSVVERRNDSKQLDEFQAMKSLFSWSSVHTCAIFQAPSSFSLLGPRLHSTLRSGWNGPRKLILEQRLHKTHIFITEIRHFLGYLRTILRLTPFLQKSKINGKVQNSEKALACCVRLSGSQLRRRRHLSC